MELNTPARRIVRRFTTTFFSAFIAQMLARLSEIQAADDVSIVLNIAIISAIAAIIMALDKASREFGR